MDYLRIIETITEYWWGNGQLNNKKFLKQEKLFIADCFSLVALPAILPVVSDYWEKTPSLVLQYIDGNYPKPELMSILKKTHQLVFMKDSKLTDNQINAWQLWQAMFSFNGSASGDPLIECVSESMICDFLIHEDLISELLFKHFNGLINLGV